MEVTKFILTSWNNANPQTINSTRTNALEMAKARAAKEESCIHVLDCNTTLVCDVASDGYVGACYFADNDEDDDFGDDATY